MTINYWDTALRGLSIAIMMTLFVRQLWWRQFLIDGWEALNIRGEELVPMEGASLTFINAMRPWSLSTLRAGAYDIVPDGTRVHNSRIEIDRFNPRRATRVLVYNNGQISRRQIEIIDRDHLLVTPAAPGNHQHMLRRMKGLLMLTSR